MLVVCPDCVSSYQVEPAALVGAAGADRCAHCRRLLPGQAGLPTEAPRAARDASAVPGLLAGIAALAMLSTLLALHRPIAAAVPATASLYRLAGLEPDATAPVVSGLKAEWGDSGVAIVGTIANPGRIRLVVPDLRISVRDGAADTLYSWIAAPPRASLGPGESFDFTSRLDKPPAGGRDLAISFVADRASPPEGGSKGIR